MKVKLISHIHNPDDFEPIYTFEVSDVRHEFATMPDIDLYNAMFGKELKDQIKIALKTTDIDIWEEGF